MNREQRTWTFQPAQDVKTVMEKAVNHQTRMVRRRKRRTADDLRGIRTALINKALRAHFADLRGKRELI